MYTLNYFYRFNDKTCGSSYAASSVATSACPVTSSSEKERRTCPGGSRSMYEVNSTKTKSVTANAKKCEKPVVTADKCQDCGGGDSSTSKTSSSSSFLMISNSIRSVRARLTKGIFKSKNNSRVSKIRPEHQLASSVKKAILPVVRSDSTSSSASSRRDFACKLESLAESKYESSVSDDYVNSSAMDELNETSQTNLMNTCNANETSKSFMLTNTTLNNSSTINDIDMTINTLEMNVSSTTCSNEEDVEKLCSNSVINLSNDEPIFDTSLSERLSHPGYSSSSSSSSDDSSLLSGLDRQPYRLNIIYRSIEDNKSSSSSNRCAHPRSRVLDHDEDDYVQIDSPPRSCSDMNLASLNKKLESKSSNDSKAIKKQYSETLKYPERKFINLNDRNSTNLVVKPHELSTTTTASQQQASSTQDFSLNSTHGGGADKSTSLSSTASCASSSSSSSAQSQSSASMNDDISRSSYDPFDSKLAESKHNYAYDKIPLYQSYDELASKTEITSKRAGSHIELFSYSLWSKLPGVIESGYLDKMTRKDIEIQERWFEIFTSELSYYKTLIILNDIIINECKPILKPYDLSLVFNRHLSTIINMSEKLIDSLQQRLEQSLLISNLFDILESVMYLDKFELYVNYASEQVSQKEHFDRLMKTNKKFNELVNKLLFDPRLQGKDMCSFLISPIQRLPRYKLLIDAVLKILPANQMVIIEQGVKLSKNLERLLKTANEKVTKYINFAETIKLQVLLKYDSKDMIILDLVSTKRQLVCHSDLISFVPTAGGVHKTNSAPTASASQTLRPPFNNKHASIDSSSIRRKKGESHQGAAAPFTSSNSASKQTYHLILFSDLLLITLKETVDKSFHYRVVEIVNDPANLSAELAELKHPSGDLHLVLSSKDCSHIIQTTSETAVVLLNASTHTLSSSSSTTSSTSSTTALALCSTALAPGPPCSYVLTINTKSSSSSASNAVQEVKQTVKASKYCFLCTKLEGENWIKHINNLSSKNK